MFFEGEVDRYIVNPKSGGGSFAVLPNHSPLTANIGYGSITIDVDETKTLRASMFGGYALVQPYQSIIMADIAEWPEEIDLDRAMEEKARAEQAINMSDADFAKARISLAKALVRIDLGNVADKLKNKNKEEM